MKIESIQVGLPKNINFKGKTITTAINKDPVPGPVMLEKLNLVGDKQAELSVHGGVDKALYAYSHDAYPAWEKLRPDFKFPYGALGENLTVDVLKEDIIFVGDIFQLGKAVVQASEPRLPCYKLGAKYNDLKMIKQFMDIGRPGVYFRVLEEGLIDRGDQLTLLDGEDLKLSILEMFHLNKGGKKDIERIREVIEIKSLSLECRTHLESIVTKHHQGNS